MRKEKAYEGDMKAVGCDRKYYSKDKSKKIDKKNVKDIIALTPMQEGMLFHYLKEPESDLYFEQLCLVISGRIDKAVFEQAWNFVIETNEMLRTTFRWERVKNPIQIVAKQHYLKPKYYDISKKENDKKKKFLEDIKAKDKQDRFDLCDIPFRVTLCKTEAEKHELIISNHHILYDGWSSGIILREFFIAYSDLYGAKELVRPLKTEFKEFVNWIKDQDIKKQGKYWRKYLKDFETQTGLSIKKRKQDEITYPATYRIHFDKALHEKTMHFVKKQEITPASFLYCTWGILLQKYNNSDDVIFGTTVSGRTAKVPGIEDMVGLFINTIPLRVQTIPHERIGDLINRINTDLQIREKCEHTSLVNIKGYSKIDNKEELFDSIVVLENYPLDSRLILENSKLAVEAYSMAEKTHYDLTIGITVFDGIQLAFGYNKETYNDDDIVRLAGHFIYIAGNIIKSPGKEVSNIEIISEEEKRQLLVDFNDREADYPGYKTLHELFEEQAEKTPDNISVAGREQDAVRRVNTGTHHLTYEQLNKKSEQLAYLLQQKGVRPDSIVGIMVERSVEMILGILAILKAGGAYLPIDQDYPEERISYMLKDSNVLLLLTTRELLAVLNENVRKGYCSGPTQASRTPYPTASNSQIAASLAYIIYTSGTTGRPKGVMVEHRNLIAYIDAFEQEFDLSEYDTVIQHVSYAFDAFVEELYPILLKGGKLMISSKGVARDIKVLCDFIVKHRVTMITCSPQLLNELNNFPHQLNSLRILISGGDRLKAEYIGNLMGVGEVYNTYGPTESTVCATYYRCLKSVGFSSDVLIGRPITNYRVYILDKYRNLLPVGVIGELCVAGLGVTRGYLNRSELTAEKFVEQVTGEGKSPPGRRRQKIYKTGDLARWLPDGNIEFIGRMDHQVKVRGFRIELGEIEYWLLSHNNVKEAVVIARDEDIDDIYLCAYITHRSREVLPEVYRGQWEPELRDYLSCKLPDYMVPSYFVLLEKMPLNVNGKIDRKKLSRAKPKPAKKSVYKAPTNEIEYRFTTIWSEVLGIDQVGIHDNFFDLGGHSLKASRLVSLLYREFNVKIPLGQLFKTPTIKDLSQYIGQSSRTGYTRIEPVELKEYYPLSSAQKRLYILQQMGEHETGVGIAYNMPSVWMLKGRLDRDIFENTFKRLIKRHESLRTSFDMKPGKPVQIVHEDAAFKIKHFILEPRFPQWETSNLKQENQIREIIKKFIKPFDLMKAPLLRAAFIRLNKEKHLLIFDMHHIISDGVSISILVREFAHLYKGETLPELRVQYKNFSEWQNKGLESKKMKKQAGYWINRFEGYITVLNMPTDYTRPEVTSFEGKKVILEIDKELTDKITRMMWDTGTTLFMILLAIYNILLSKYTEQEDIIVGVPIAGRTHADLENVFGMFVNTLAIRNYPIGERTFVDFLQDIKENTLKAYENQDYPLDELINTLGLSKNFGRNPLFDVLFVSDDTGIPTLKLEDLTFTPYEFDRKISHLDLVLYITESNGTISLILEYASVLFKQTTAEEILKHYVEILEQVVTDIELKLEDIKIYYDLLVPQADILKEKQDDFLF